MHAAGPKLSERKGLGNVKRGWKGIRTSALISRRHELIALAATVLAEAAAARPTGTLEITYDYDQASKLYDKFDNSVIAASLGFPSLRQGLVSQASGRVLETGVGTGADHLPPAAAFTVSLTINTKYHELFGELARAMRKQDADVRLGHDLARSDAPLTTWRSSVSV
jgi:hypothetical protein